MTQIRAEIYDFDSDMYGNPTSHFTLWQDGQVIFRTSRRQQCGYSHDRSDSALYKANKLSDTPLRLASFEGRRSGGTISAKFGA